MNDDGLFLLCITIIHSVLQKIEFLSTIHTEQPYTLNNKQRMREVEFLNVIKTEVKASDSLFDSITLEHDESGSAISYFTFTWLALCLDFVMRRKFNRISMKDI